MTSPSWKTTSAGILAIVGALVGLYFTIKNKTVTAESITGCVSAILVGIGLLLAKDSNVTGGTKSNGMVLKILILAVIMSGIGIAAQGQGIAYKYCPKDFVIKAKTYDLRSVPLNQDSVLASLNKWDIATGVTGPSLNLKTGAFGAVNSAGFGIIRTWYKLTSDKLTVYKTWGIGGMLLFGDTNGNPLYSLNTSIGKADVGIMAAGGYGPILLGPTYFTVSRTLLLNLQATFTF